MLKGENSLIGGGGGGSARAASEKVSRPNVMMSQLAQNGTREMHSGKFFPFQGD